MLLKGKYRICSEIAEFINMKDGENTFLRLDLDLSSMMGPIGSAVGQKNYSSPRKKLLTKSPLFWTLADLKSQLIFNSSKKLKIWKF